MNTNKIKTAINKAAIADKPVHDEAGQIVTNSWFPYFQNDGLIDFSEMIGSKSNFNISAEPKNIIINKNEIKITATNGCVYYIK